MPRPRAVADEPLLSALTLAFWRGGYASTGVRELEAACGLKAPSLYHRFGSKEATFDAALEHYIAVVVSMRIKRYLQAENPLRGLREFFESTCDTASEQRPALGCLLVNTALELGSADPKVARSLARGRRMIRAALHANLLRAQRAGALRAGADLDVLADSLFLGLTGLLVECRGARDAKRLQRHVRALMALLPVRKQPQKRKVTA